MANFCRHFVRNRLSVAGVSILVLLTICAIFAPMMAPNDPIEANISLRLEPPSALHLLGTDQLGRDILSRVIWGARTSLRGGALVVLLSSVSGVFLGVISGYWSGPTGMLIMRFVDFLLAFPSFLLAMGIVAILGASLSNAILAVSISYVGPLARLARGVTIKVKENNYVEAARALGSPDLYIIIRHILPNILSPLVVQSTLNFGGAIVDIAGLSFLGLGAQPPTPEWGALLSSARQYIRVAWWLTTFPGLAIMSTVVSFIFIGDGVREAMDPRQRRKR